MTIHQSLRSVLFLLLIFAPVMYLARALVLSAEQVTVYHSGEDPLHLEKAAFSAAPTGPRRPASVPAAAPAAEAADDAPAEIDMDAAAARAPGAADWSLPEKFLPELSLGEWVTQSFQDEREVRGRKVKLTVLIDLRRVRVRGQLSGVQFREPRFFVEGGQRAVVFRSLDLVFNSRPLDAIQAYRDLNLVVPEGELVSLGTEAAQPLVVLPLEKGANFLGLKISELEVFDVGGGPRLMADRAK